MMNRGRENNEHVDAKELTINIGGRGCGKTFQQAVHNENIKLLNELLEEKK